MPYDVAVLVGSLRKDSLTRKLVEALKAIATENLRLDIVDIGQLPHFNQDFESTPPPEVTDFKRRIEAADAVLFATPNTTARFRASSRTPSTPGRVPMARARGTASLRR